MTFLLFLFGIFLALGMFLLTADLLRLPRLATQRAMLSVGRQEKKQARSVEALLMGWAIKLAPHIHMDEYKGDTCVMITNKAKKSTSEYIVESYDGVYFGVRSHTGLYHRVSPWRIFRTKEEAIETLAEQKYGGISL